MEQLAAEGDGAPARPRRARVARLRRVCLLVVATVLHGVGCGLISIFVCILIRQVQIIGYGKGPGSFLVISETAPPWRRMLSVSFAGIFGAVCWLYMRGIEPSFVPVKDSIKGKKMPAAVTWLNAMLQDIVVALGGSVGREAAPREMSAMYAGHLADALGVAPEHRSILVACGTGAGLAGVYSVPISGAIYTVEHTLHWDTRPLTVIVATVTSFLATYVAQYVVEACCIYPAPKYSAEWPSLAIMLWSALIGPLAGAAAHLFCRLIAFAQAQRPLGRMPVKFHAAPVGHHVRMLFPQECGGSVRQKVLITGKVDSHVFVRSEDGEELELSREDWNAREPLGWRDWSILVGMPTAFLGLALLCVKYPALLGNGRALAQVAMDDDRDTPLWELLELFILKALVTAAALGAGADGGTLTPSVALGATLGAMVAKPWRALWPGSIALQQAAIVTSTAFLGSAMNAPVSGLCLLVEFSGQGVDQDALAATLHGDFLPLWQSRLAVGMLLPMVVAVVEAQWVCRYLHDRQHAKPPTPRPRFDSDLASPVKAPQSMGMRISAAWGAAYRGAFVAADLDIDDEDFGVFTLDDDTKTACLLSFRFCLLANTCVTVGVATTFFSHETGHLITIASTCGVVLATTVCAMARLGLMARKSGRSLRPKFQRQTSGDNLKALLGLEKAQPDYTPLCACAGLRLRLYSAGAAALAGACGAAMPLVPWALEIWRNHQDVACMIASVATAALAIALVTTTELRRNIGGIYVMEAEGERQAMVVKRMGYVFLASAVAATLGGFTWLIPIVDYA